MIHLEEVTVDCDPAVSDSDNQVDSSRGPKRGADNMRQRMISASMDSLKCHAYHDADESMCLLIMSTLWEIGKPLWCIIMVVILILCLTIFIALFD